jgi:hypothetical protein
MPEAAVDDTDEEAADEATGALVLEYSPRHGPRRRIEYRPARKCPHWWRVEQERCGDGWRVLGREPVSQPELTDDRDLARAEAGP